MCVCHAFGSTLKLQHHLIKGDSRLYLLRVQNCSQSSSPYFSVFWDLYCAAPERRDVLKHSPDARAFYDYVSPFGRHLTTAFVLLQARMGLCVWPIVVSRVLKLCARVHVCVPVFSTLVNQSMWVSFHLVCAIAGVL